MIVLVSGNKKYFRLDITSAKLTILRFVNCWTNMGSSRFGILNLGGVISCNFSITVIITLLLNLQLFSCCYSSRHLHESGFRNEQQQVKHPQDVLFLIVQV